MAAAPPEISLRELFRLRRAGWILIVLALWTAVILAVLWPIVTRKRTGDGSHVESYGFDLTTCLVPRGQMLAAPLAKEGLQALDNPPLLTGPDIAFLGVNRHTKVLVASDRVIGLELDGAAYAFPLRFLNWHEVVNLDAGQRAVAVTWHPISGSAVVFDRKADGEVLRLGISGLLYNSNQLLYDRRQDGKGESLWSQLQGRAIAGPAAATGKHLAILPSCVTTWGQWFERHPNTRVCTPPVQGGLAKNYRSDPYLAYFTSPGLKYPVSPMPPQSDAAPKDSILAIEDAGGWRVFSLKQMRQSQSEVSRCEAVLSDGTVVKLEIAPDAQSADVQFAPPERSRGVIQSFWFAWYAQHPGSRIEAGGQGALPK